jgi:hypothetical protein
VDAPSAALVGRVTELLNPLRSTNALMAFTLSFPGSIQVSILTPKRFLDRASATVAS